MFLIAQTTDGAAPGVYGPRKQTAPLTHKIKVGVDLDDMEWPPVGSSATSDWVRERFCSDKVRQEMFSRGELELSILLID